MLDDMFVILGKVTKECGAAHGPPVHIGDPLVLGIKVHEFVQFIRLFISFKNLNSLNDVQSKSNFIVVVIVDNFRI
jgi:hypothetical protein